MQSKYWNALPQLQVITKQSHIMPFSHVQSLCVAAKCLSVHLSHTVLQKWHIVDKACKYE